MADRGWDGLRLKEGSEVVRLALVLLDLVVGAERYHLWNSAGPAADIGEIWVFKNSTSKYLRLCH
ncbi:unnamed protein product [Prunus armeniaca]